MNAPQPVEFLYGIQAGQYDGNDDWHDPHVVAFRIWKKTPKRTYYVAREWGPRPPIRFVDRHRIETDGEVYQRSRHWFEPDKHLYLTEPEIPSAPKPSIADLKAAMAAAHPDRGGTNETFIAARRRYETARATAKETTA